MNMAIRNYVIATLAALALTACGGGGGGGDSGSGGEPLKITSDNSEQVAAASFDAFESSAGGSTGSLTATGVEITGSGEPSPGLAALLHGEVLRALELDADPQNTVAGVVLSETFLCELGGTVTLKLDDTNNNGFLDIGESFTITYDNCNFGSVIVDGTFTLVFNAATPSLAEVGSSFVDWSYEASLKFKNFSVTDKATGDTETLNSNVTITADFVSALDETTVTIEGSFEVTNLDGTLTMKGYRFSAVFIGSGGLYRDATLEGRLTIGSLGGDVNLSTGIPFENQSEDFVWPEIGTLRAAEPGGPTFVELNADTGDEGTVMITTNDGATQTSVIKNWADL